MLDPGPSAGISKQLVAQLLLVLQPSLTHSCFSGYSIGDVGSVLWSLASIVGACGWGPELQEVHEDWGTLGDPISSSDWDSTSSGGANTHSDGGWEGRQGVVAAVQAWLCGKEGAAAVEGCCSFPQLVSVLWGYAALAGGGGGAAVIHMHQPTAGGAAAGQGASAEDASAGAGCGGEGDGDGDEAEWAVGEQAVGAAFDRVVQRTAALFINGYYTEQPSAVELADAVWALSVVGRRWVEGTGCGTGKLLVAPVTVFLCFVLVHVRTSGAMARWRL